MLSDDPRNLVQDEVKEFLVHDCLVLPNKVFTASSFASLLSSIGFGAQIRKLGLQDAENPLRILCFRLPTPLRWGAYFKCLTSLTLTTMPIYSAGNPYRSTLSTNSRMTFRCTRIWKDSEKFVRASRSSSVCSRTWSYRRATKRDELLPIVPSPLFRPYPIPAAALRSPPRSRQSLGQWICAKPHELVEWTEGCGRTYFLGTSGRSHHALSWRWRHWTMRNRRPDRSGYYAEDELSEPRLLRETHFDVRGTTICVSRSYPLFHSFTSILESR